MRASTNAAAGIASILTSTMGFLFVFGLLLDAVVVSSYVQLRGEWAIAIMCHYGMF
jgi:hypothetical protein